MNNTLNRTQWLTLAGALLIACAAGFVAARLTSSSTPAVTEAAPEEKSGELKIPDESLRTMDIVLATVAPGDLNAEVQAPGSVVAAPGGQAVLTAHAAGTVTRLFKRLGDPVKAGDTLATVESREAATLAAERSTADSQLRLARSVLEREQNLHDQKVTPRQDLDAAKAQYAAADADSKRARAAAAAAGVLNDSGSIAITSPISGRIAWSDAQLGAYVDPNTALFRIADPRQVLIEATVPVLDARAISPQDAAKVVTSAGTILDARVLSVTPTLDRQTRAATVTLSLSPNQPLPTQGEYLQVRISTQAPAGQGFALDDEAVQNIGGASVVFVKTPTGFKATPVIVRHRSGGRAWVVSGLTAGDVIAGKNAFLLKAQMGKNTGEEE